MARAASFGEPEEIGTPRHPALITGAPKSIEQERHDRVRKYTILMAFRIPALIIAGIVYSEFQNGLIAIAILAVSVPLPWIAVLIANDRPPRRADEPSRYRPQSAHTEFGHEIEGPHETIDGSSG
ncbi:DUF3099 domain-containing protein [Skermania sp. ID1734]|uniref:DUF3099 domain-containing protein n=1 Tax=Skermania sp. ID1734 TaxID=2597516 RepID=UPI00118108BF|nr:DUF3099 domain-containing protein [Skermania sp. ID1734]TSD96039.1 DUF3099 domain-containing protein [Skermania sp. ID1734]